MEFIVRTFDRRFLKNGDILDDFLSHIDDGLNPRDISRPAARINSGLRLEQYEVLRALHRLGKDNEAQRLSAKPIPGDDDSHERVFRYYYTGELRQFLARKYYPDNAKLLEEFLPDASEPEREFWMTVEAAVAPPTIDIETLAKCLICSRMKSRHALLFDLPGRVARPRLRSVLPIALLSVAGLAARRPPPARITADGRRAKSANRVALTGHRPPEMRRVRSRLVPRVCAPREIGSAGSRDAAISAGPDGLARCDMAALLEVCHDRAATGT